MNNVARYANLAIKTSIEIDMDQEKWTLPCFRSVKKYVIRDKQYIREKYKDFSNIEVLFDDVDKILSVSKFSFLSFLPKKTKYFMPLQYYQKLFAFPYGV